MKKLLSILLLFVSFGALAQTYDTLPAGSKPYGNFYLGPDGNLVFGNVGLKYRVLGTKKRVDSLLALKAPVSGSANYIQNNNTGTSQSASFNINGIGRFDSPTSTTLFGAGVGSFSTEYGVSTINGGTVNVGTELITPSLTVNNSLGPASMGAYVDNNGTGAVGWVFNPDGNPAVARQIRYQPSESGRFYTNHVSDGAGANKEIFAYISDLTDYVTVAGSGTITGTKTLTNFNGNLNGTLDVTGGLLRNTNPILYDKVAYWDGSGYLGYNTISGILGYNPADASLTQLKSEKAQPNGYASLDGSGKVPLSQISDALIGSVNYRGSYNYTTNTPSLPAVGSGNKGWYYILSDSGIYAPTGKKYYGGDWIISNGSVWDILNQSNRVSSVNGMVGNVSITDITGNAGSATLWGGSPANFVTPIGNITAMIAFSDAGFATYFAASDVRAFLDAQTISNLSTNLTSSSTKYPNVDAVNTGLTTTAKWQGESIATSSKAVGDIVSYNGTNWINKTISATSPLSWNASTSNMSVNLSAIVQNSLSASTTIAPSATAVNTGLATKITQGGDSFGVDMVIGTNNAHDLKFVRNAFESLVISNTAAFNVPISAPNFASGTYTPTLTIFNNATSVTADLCHYTRIGDQVTVSGQYTTTTGASAALDVIIKVSLPPGLSSNFTAANDLTGSGSIQMTTNPANVTAQADATDDVAIVRHGSTPAATSGVVTYFTFTYTVK